MARKTREDAAATREQLLDAAERVFRDRGVTRTSLGQSIQAGGYLAQYGTRHWIVVDDEVFQMNDE